MKKRFITGIILAVVLIPLLFLSELIFYAFIGLLVLGAGFELFHMMYKDREAKPVLLVVQVLLTFVLYGVLLSVFLALINPLMLILVSLIIMLIGLVMMVFDNYYAMNDFGKTLVSIWYVAGCFAAIAMVRSLGIDVLIYMLILAMVTDMFAYFVGIAIGKHKLAKDISPKKTIEGAVGGTIIAVIVATAYARVFTIFVFDHIIILIIASLFVSFIAQLGDLVASKMKREHHIKDFSNLLPGHGGILDRFDSSLFASLALMIVVLFIEVL